MKFATFSLKSKINLVLGLLLLSIFVCWVGFYVRTRDVMKQSSENLVTQMSGRVSDLVYTTFLYLEHTAMVLSTSTDIADLLQEDTPLIYYAIRDNVRALADSVYQPNGLVDDILVYDMSENFCRLRGNLGNTAATRLGYLLPEQTPLQHGIVTLEGSTYLTYVVEVNENHHQLGYIVFLMEITHLQTIFESYDTSGLLSIALVAQDMLVSESKAYSSATIIARQSNTYSLTPIGTSPFSVLVWDDGTLHQKLLQQFFVIGIFISILLLLLMGGGYRLLHQLVFSPLLTLMDNAKEVEKNPTRHLLDRTGQLEFDQLVAQFNQLILQLEERTNTTLALERAMQATELERQTAIITSLKKQINAHFTVNTLAVIRRLNQLGETEKVGKLSDGLAYLLRYAHDGDALIACIDELDILERYLTMMQIRYPGRFEADLDIDATLEDHFIPRMLLQPILENAILHGFSNQTNGILTLRGHQNNDTIQFIIKDNGKGMALDALKTLRHQINTIEPTSHIPNGLEHVALTNIQKRIVTDFGIGYGLTIDATPSQGCIVTVALPLHCF